jgi:hypothetical protein
MHTHLATKKVRLIIGVVIAAFLIMPLLIHAQTTSQSALDATIRAAIMQDPRSASLTSTQIDAMVTALSAKAQTQGLTAQNIAYRPGTAGIVVPAGVTANTPMVSDPCALSPACAVGNFLGSGLANNATYVALWILSLLLMFIVWHMRKNPHLFGLHDTPNTPAIGGGV